MTMNANVMNEHNIKDKKRQWLPIYKIQSEKFVYYEGKLSGDAYMFIIIDCASYLRYAISFTLVRSRRSLLMLKFSFRYHLKSESSPWVRLTMKYCQAYL